MTPLLLDKTRVRGSSAGKRKKIKSKSGEIIQFFFSKGQASQLFTFAGGGEVSLMQ